MSKGDSHSTLPWVEKYRPNAVEDVLSHTDIISTILKLIECNRMPHLLLYGPAGTGKTSTILAVARRLYGDRLKSNVLELNASDERGIDVVRERVKDFASTRQLFGKHFGFKLVILDEADQMTNDAQAALRRVIEMFTQNVRFCIICNHVNKILPAIQSRCTRFRFGPLNKKMVVMRLREISDAEKCSFTEGALAAVYKLSGGDMRRALNIMQGVAMSYPTGDEIGEIAIYQATGCPSPNEIRDIIDIMVNRGFKEASCAVREQMASQGLALADIVREIHPILCRMDLPPKARTWAVSQLADLEYQLAFSCNDSLQLLGLISIMQMLRASITEEKDIGAIHMKGFMEG